MKFLRCGFDGHEESFGFFGNTDIGQCYTGTEGRQIGDDNVTDRTIGVDSKWVDDKDHQGMPVLAKGANGPRCEEILADDKVFRATIYDHSGSHIWTVERVISMFMRTGWCGQSIYHNVLSAKALGIPLRNGSSDRQVNILEETLYLRVSRIPLSPRKGNCNFYRGLSLARKDR